MKSNKNIILKLFSGTALLAISSLLAAAPVSSIAPPLHEECQPFDLGCLVESVIQTELIPEISSSCIKDPSNLQSMPAKAWKVFGPTTGVPEQPCK